MREGVFGDRESGVIGWGGVSPPWMLELSQAAFDQKQEQYENEKGKKGAGRYGHTVRNSRSRTRMKMASRRQAVNGKKE